MESQQQQQQQHQDQDGGINKSSSSYLCRQTSSRWTPTSEQIRILKELYYNNGIRSPTADQIQRISARLRQYGKIEGKNVFYWFQNHKARERQKKRFITTPADTGHLLDPITNSSMNMIPCIHPTQRSPVSLASWRSSSDHHLLQDPTNIYKNHHLYTPNTISPHAAGVGYPSSSSSSRAGVMSVGQMGSCAYGSVAMERSFRECSISPGDSRAIGHNFGYSYSSAREYHSFVDKMKPHHEQETLEEGDDDEEGGAGEIETLPLFPMHADADASSDFFDIKSESQSSSEHAHDYAHSHASLELTLNSCTPSFKGFS